jgi:hypothetical protein
VTLINPDAEREAGLVQVYCLVAGAWITAASIAMVYVLAML